MNAELNGTERGRKPQSFKSLRDGRDIQRLRHGSSPVRVIPSDRESADHERLPSRLLPEGMTITVNQEVEAAEWEELGFQATKNFRLDAELNGTNYGHIRAEKRIKKTWDTENKEIDRYVYLSHIFVETMREHGIGSSLLVEMERQAREFGASRIEGMISDFDMLATPRLSEFYRHRGYQLTPRGGGFLMVKPIRSE